MKKQYQRRSGYRLQKRTLFSEIHRHFRHMARQCQPAQPWLQLIGMALTVYNLVSFVRSLIC